MTEIGRALMHLQGTVGSLELSDLLKILHTVWQLLQVPLQVK